MQRDTQPGSAAGAVFFMDPEHGATGITCRPGRGCPGGGVAVAQLTVPTGDPCEGAVSAQGRSVSGADWDVRELRFSGATAPPPPAPAPPPAAPTRTPTPCPDDPDLVLWDMVLSLCAPIDVAAAPQGAMSSSSGNRRDLKSRIQRLTRGDHAGRAQVESSQARTQNDSCHPPRLQRSSGRHLQRMDTGRQHVRFFVPPQPRRQRDDVIPAQPGDYRMVSPTSQSLGHCAGCTRPSCPRPAAS